MNNPRTMPLMTVVLFIAVVLSCTIYFGLTALIASPASFAQTPYREDAALPENMTAFDRGFFLDSTLQEWITANDYRVFGQIADSRVMVGKEEFLFPLTASETNSVYHYLEDYTGNAVYSDEALARIAKSLSKRSIAYANQDCTYILAVIPSVQTVYREYLPWGLGDTGGKTRLNQLKSYLQENGDSLFLDLTDCLLEAKKKGQVFNNTEDSLNAYGAYAVYRAVLEAMPDSVGEKITPVDASSIHIFTRNTAGKALARIAGVESLVQNRTLSLSNDTLLKYQALERVAGMEITYVKPAYKDEIANRPAVLLEFGVEWDKILLMPYFSNTFGIAAYKTNPAYSQLAVDYLSPAVVVQFIHESELDSLLDETILLSYNDGLQPGDDPFSAMMPIVLGTARSGEDRICIVGRCEEGSTVRISGNGIHTALVETQGERFIIEAVFEEGRTSAAVVLTASVPDKQDSSAEPLSLTLSSSGEDTQIRVGSNSMLFRTDGRSEAYSGIYTRQQLRRVSTHYTEEAERSARLTGKQTQMVYVYIPDKLDVYREVLEDAGMPYAHIARVAQLSDALRSYNRISVMDMTMPLRTARSAGLLYRQTDSTLTPLGGFSAYRAMMLVLSETDPRMTPLYRSDFLQSTEIQPGGDLIDALGLDGASITEQVTVLTPRQDNVRVSALEQDMLLYTNRDESLPVAVVLRDREGTQIVPYLVQHFSQVYVLPEGELSLPDELLRTVKPDYVFSLTSEYHLPLN